MFKKILFLILFLVALMLLAYWLQPVKKGKGLDKSISYQLEENWPDLPAGLYLGNPTGICFDTSQNLIVFRRAKRKWPLLGSMPNETINEKTILVIDRVSGKLLNSWGDNLFIMPHGLKVDNENNIWVTDVGLHQVFKFSHEGKLLMALGEKGVSGNDNLHFNKPTDIAITKNGSFYVSDGYGNSRIIKFSATGKYLFEWGNKGTVAGEFNIPHGITLDSTGNIYVADRENNRIQVFDSTGKYIKQFSDNSYAAICAIDFNKDHSKLFAVDDFRFLKLKHRGSDIFSLDSAGSVQTRLGRSGDYKGPTTWYHCIAIDNDENIYVGDIRGNKIWKFTVKKAGNK